MFGLVPSTAGAWDSCGLVDRSSRLDFQVPGTECWVSLSLVVWAHLGHWTSLSLVSQYAKWEAKGELTGVPPKGAHAPQWLKKMLCSHFKLHLFIFFKTNKHSGLLYLSLYQPLQDPCVWMEAIARTRAFTLQWPTSILLGWMAFLSCCIATFPVS